MNEYRYLPGLLRVIGRDWLRGIQVHVDILVRTIYTYTYNLHARYGTCVAEPEPPGIELLLAEAGTRAEALWLKFQP